MEGRKGKEVEGNEKTKLVKLKQRVVKLTAELKKERREHVKERVKLMRIIERQAGLLRTSAIWYMPAQYSSCGNTNPSSLRPVTAGAYPVPSQGG
jgi:hypothetical protein